MYYTRNNGDRFIFPFLVGALAGGAAVGITRPRPVVVTGAPMYPAPYGPGPVYYNSYQYYRPY